MSDTTVALVTNGSYGVGREIVKSLDASGVRVAVGARGSRSRMAVSNRRTRRPVSITG
jgi:NAD(P)-dependent dehydrogenase (short-subunit alcohol dehydrogenase family)